MTHFYVQHGLGKHCDAFRQRNIDGHSFTTLVEQDLARLGVVVRFLVPPVRFLVPPEDSSLLIATF